MKLKDNNFLVDFFSVILIFKNLQSYQLALFHFEDIYLISGTILDLGL